jgi:stearoyl-CoA desaturase (delta-9 desaturase)
MTIFELDNTFHQPINWITVSFMVAFHVAAIAAPFYFTWKAFVLAVVMY